MNEYLRLPQHIDRLSVLRGSLGEHNECAYQLIMVVLQTGYAASWYQDEHGLRRCGLRDDADRRQAEQSWHDGEDGMTQRMIERFEEWTGISPGRALDIFNHGRL